MEKTVGRKVPFSYEEKDAVLEAIDGWVNLLNDAHLKDEDDIRLIDVLIKSYRKISDNTIIIVKPQREKNPEKPEVDLLITHPEFLEIS
jgi:hypothetical protein